MSYSQHTRFSRSGFIFFLSRPLATCRAQPYFRVDPLTHETTMKCCRLSGAAAFAMLASVSLAHSAIAQTRATLVLTNGHIVTVDSTRPEAQAVAIAGDRIIAIGTNAEIQRLVTSSTRVIDLQGRLAVPGFIEGHGHFMGLGQSKLQLDLTKVKNWDEIVAMV